MYKLIAQMRPHNSLVVYVSEKIVNDTTTCSLGSDYSTPMLTPMLII